MRNLLILTLMLILSSATQAQPRKGPPPPLSKEKREKVEAMKVAFLTQRLKLTPEEAKVFWPVYNQMSDELYELRNARMKEMRSMRSDGDSLTDKESERIFDSEVTHRQAELDILKKYHPQLKKTLPAKKLAKLHRAEEDFRHELLEKLKDGGGGGRGPSHQKGKRN
ncbi:MAG: hypothetical protein ACK5C5_05000 [Bacteroidota bacterium]|jgi:hypothetical protein